MVSRALVTQYAALLTQHDYPGTKGVHPEALEIAQRIHKQGGLAEVQRQIQRLQQIDQVQ